MSKRRFHRAWIVLGVCFTDVFISYSIRLGFGILLPVMIPALHMNRTAAGAIINSYFLVYVFITPLTGNLTDRFGARTIITIFSIILGVGALLMGTTNQVWTACIFFGLAGAGASAMWTSVVTIVQKWFTPRRRGMALGFLSTGFGLSFAAMGLLFPSLVNSLSWRYCWYVLGTWTLVIALLNVVFLRSSPDELQMFAWGGGEYKLTEDSSRKNLLRGNLYSEVFFSSQFWIIGVSYLLISYANYTVTTFMVDYANMELGFNFSQASYLVSIRGLSQIVGVLIIPFLSDRIGRKIAISGSNLLIVLSTIGFTASGKELPIFLTSIVFHGIFSGAIWPMYGACAGDYFRKEVIGTVIGAWTPFYGLGAILAHFIGGRIYDKADSYQMAFFLAILFGMLAAFLILMVKKVYRG
jgi:MFS family permease